MNNDEIDLTPNYPVLRRQFSRNARLRADTILADLLPETLIPAEYIKQVQRDVLREFQGILNSIDVVAQCTTNTEELLELRELIHEVSQAIVTKADAIERAMNGPTLQQMPPPFSTFRTSDGYTLRWSEEHQIWFDAKTWEERDLVFGARIDGWPMTDMDEEIEGNYIKEGE